MRILRLWPLLIIVAYAIVLTAGLGDYMRWTSASFILGIIALLVTTSCNKNAKGSQRFFWISLTLFILFLLIPAKTFLYLSVAAAGLFFIEIFYGRINPLPQLVLLLMSSWAYTLADLFTFPIRLQLTEVAGKMLRLTGNITKVQGNMISCNGNEFSVDPACMGLQMIITSLLCAMILLGFYQKKFNKELKGWQVLSILGFTVCLNIIANLFRIVCLVQFNILPDNLMHEMLGIICLITYVIIPVTFINKWCVQRFGSIRQNLRGTYQVRSTSRMLGSNALLATCLLIGISKTQKATQPTINIPAIAGYKTQPLPGNVIKLENSHSLIYIKHIPGCYYAEHHPMICWRGSGYEFQQIEERMIDGGKVYTALLQQGNDKFYTAWWYENGQARTTSQLAWRWDVFLGGHPYSLVNVTAANEEQLEKEIGEIRHLKPLASLL